MLVTRPGVNSMFRSTTTTTKRRNHSTITNPWQKYLHPRPGHCNLLLLLRCPYCPHFSKSCEYWPHHCRRARKSRRTCRFWDWSPPAAASFFRAWWVGNCFGRTLVLRSQNDWLAVETCCCRKEKSWSNGRWVNCGSNCWTKHCQIKNNKVKRTKVMSVFHGYAILVLYQKYGGNSSRNKGSTRNLCATVHGTTAPQVTYLGGVREYVCCCWWWWWW